MGLKVTSKENTQYHLNNILNTFNYNRDETLLNDILNTYGPYTNFFQSNWQMLLKKFIRNGFEILSIQNDRLDLISNRFYNTTSLWAIIHLFNPQISNPFIIPTGTTIFIPDFNEIKNFFEYFSLNKKENNKNLSNTNILEF